MKNIFVTLVLNMFFISPIAFAQSPAALIKYNLKYGYLANFSSKEVVIQIDGLVIANSQKSGSVVLATLTPETLESISALISKVNAATVLVDTNPTAPIIHDTPLITITVIKDGTELTLKSEIAGHTQILKDGTGSSLVKLMEGFAALAR